jgi:zinc/manganese transport system substrate-binding protein
MRATAQHPRRWHRVGIALAMAVVAVGLSGCNSGGSSASGVIAAVGAENQYANVIAQIGGRYVHVAAIMSNPSVDPHTFEVSTSVAQVVSQARLVVQNGLGYDQFMTQLESASPSSSRRVIDVQHLLTLSDATPNPHLWYKPTTMPIVAAAIERDLAAMAPTHANYFAARLARFRSSFAPLTAQIHAFRARFAGDVVATTEPVADYLLTALGLVDATPWRLQADVMNGIDPAPEDVATLQTMIRDHHVAALCYNAQVTSSVTLALRSLAQSAGVPIVAVYETMPEPGYDYQSWMSAEIHALTLALTTHHSTTELR